MKHLGVYGASGFGREVLPLLRKKWAEEISQQRAQLYFIDDAQKGQSNGVEVLDFEEFLALPGQDKAVCLAIASNAVRRHLAQKCKENAVQMLDIHAESVTILDEVQLGQGSILCPQVCLTSNIKIGEHFQANIFSYVGHDSVIGDFVTFAPRVSCNGNIVIEDDVYVGTGAMLRQGTPQNPLIVGRGAVIGMGAVVTKSVSAGMTVVGNPARPLHKS